MSVVGLQLLGGLRRTGSRCSPVSDRCVYAGVVEHSVRVHADARGTGIGKALLDALISSSEAAGIWIIQSGIVPENTASAALHTACRFCTVGTGQRIRQHHGAARISTGAAS